MGKRKRNKTSKRVETNFWEAVQSLPLDKRKEAGLPVCSVCEVNPPLVGYDMCGPCTFGEAASLLEEDHEW